MTWRVTQLTIRSQINLRVTVTVTTSGAQCGISFGSLTWACDGYTVDRPERQGQIRSAGFLRSSKADEDSATSAHTMAGFYDACPLKAVPKVVLKETR
jgi:hypothetical protein